MLQVHLDLNLVRGSFCLSRSQRLFLRGIEESAGGVCNYYTLYARIFACESGMFNLNLNFLS